MLLEVSFVSPKPCGAWMTDRSIFTQSCTGEKHTYQCLDKDDENAKNLKKKCVSQRPLLPELFVFSLLKKFSALAPRAAFSFELCLVLWPTWKGKAWTWESFAAFWMSWGQTSDSLESGRLRFQFYHAMNWTLLWASHLSSQAGISVFTRRRGLNLIGPCVLAWDGASSRKGFIPEGTFGSSLSLLILCGLQQPPCTNKE